MKYVAAPQQVVAGGGTHLRLTCLTSGREDTSR